MPGARGAAGFLGSGVLASQREVGVRGRSHERQVHDLLHTDRACGVHCGEMLLQAVLRLPPRDEEQGPHTVEGASHVVGVPYVAAATGTAP